MKNYLLKLHPIFLIGFFLCVFATTVACQSEKGKVVIVEKNQNLSFSIPNSIVARILTNDPRFERAQITNSIRYDSHHSGEFTGLQIVCRVNEVSKKPEFGVAEASFPYCQFEYFEIGANEIEFVGIGNTEEDTVSYSLLNEEGETVFTGEAEMSTSEFGESLVKISGAPLVNVGTDVRGILFSDTAGDIATLPFCLEPMKVREFQPRGRQFDIKFNRKVTPTENHHSEIVAIVEVWSQNELLHYGRTAFGPDGETEILVPVTLRESVPLDARLFGQLRITLISTGDPSEQDFNFDTIEMGLKTIQLQEFKVGQIGPANKGESDNKTLTLFDIDICFDDVFGN